VASMVEEGETGTILSTRVEASWFGIPADARHKK
jgi:hypothetical protein